jgi:predicted hydrolase (HD superfamily)
MSADDFMDDADIQSELTRTKRALEMAREFIRDEQLGSHHCAADEVMTAIKKEVGE